MNTPPPAQMPPSQTPPGKTPMGGGCLIAAGLLLGPLVGLALGQVSAGLVAGGAIGVLAAVALTLMDRKR